MILNDKSVGGTSSGGGGGSVAFADITGSPSDNSSLQTSINDAKGVTLIETITLGSAASSLDFTSLDLSNYFRIELVSTQVATDIAAGVDTLMCRFNGDTGTNYNTIFFGRQANDTTVTSSTDGDGQTTLRLTDVAGNSITNKLDKTVMEVEIYNPGSTTEIKGIITRSHIDDITGGSRSTWTSGTWTASSAITSISIYSFNSANISSGSTVHLYGYKKLS